MLKKALFGLMLLCSVQFLHAQNLIRIGQRTLLPAPLRSLKSEGLSFRPAPENVPEINAPSARLIQPEFVRENPTGYSFFCRLELDIEKRAPIGVWLKVTDAWQQEGNSLNNLSLRLKMLRF